MSDDKVKAWIEAARRDGDEEAARAIEELLARAEKAESRARDLQAKLADYMRADTELMEAAEKWKACAEQAERERDKADRRTLELCAVLEAEMQARCRAEADNAALLDALRDAIDNARPDDPNVWVRVWAVRDADHPGAALLERLRALESAARDALECMEEDWPERPVTRVLTAALKEQP